MILLKDILLLSFIAILIIIALSKLRLPSVRPIPYLQIALIILSSGSFYCNKSQTDKTDTFWTKNNSPQKIGRMIINDLLKRPELMMYKTDFWTGVHYAEACAGFGAARLAGLWNDADIIEQLAERYTKVIDDSLVKNANHVDANVYGILPLELYMLTKENQLLNQGLQLADQQWEDTLNGGLTSQTRFWIDDVWMIGSLQVQAYRVTGEQKYLNRAALEAHAYLQKLQQPNGLFFHGENAPFYWGRGNGWVAAGLAEIVSELPESNPYYSTLLTGYKNMMVALGQYQAEDGMWRQLIDKEESWEETSSTAMFGYAITIGVKKGILNRETFTPVYQKAWQSLVGYIDSSGKLHDVCVGTGKSDDINYYLNRPRTSGDLHGQAPVLWFAYSLSADY